MSVNEETTMIEYYTYSILLVLTCISYAWLFESSHKTTMGENILDFEWDYIVSQGMGSKLIIREYHNKYFPNNFLHSIAHIWYYPDFYTRVLSINVFNVNIQKAEFSPRAIKAVLHKSHLDENYIGHYYGFNYVTLIFDKTTLLLKMVDDTLLYKPIKLINTDLSRYDGYTDIEAHHKKLVEEHENVTKTI